MKTPDIDGYEIDYGRVRGKCAYCSSTSFHGPLLEPETIESIEVAGITHDNWELIAKEEKIERIEKELIIKGIIKTT